MRRVAAIVAPIVAALVLPVGVAAQSAGASMDEVRLLREASVQEAQGQLAAAEQTLEKVLEARASSVPALLALERLLRVQARLEDLVRPVETALAEDRRSALLNQLLIRTYSALDRVQDMETAADAWIQTVPNIEIPYREISAVWQSRGDFGRARAVLEAGRSRINRPDALALELGDLYADLGEPERAVREWERAIGDEARGLNQVRRRLRSLADGGADMLPGLVDALMREPTTQARLEAAVDLAISAGLEERAEAAADAALVGIQAGGHQAFLIEVARRADGARLNDLAYWAYGWLASLELEDAKLLAIRSRLAQLALERGDTAAATASYEEVEAAYDPGSPERRQAAALRIELMAHQDMDAAIEEFRTFRVDYPAANEADRLAAAIADVLLDAGRADDAELVLTGVRGPRSSMYRGRIALEQGDIDGARLAYMSAAPGLRGAEATRVLSLVTLLGSVSAEGARLLGAAMRLQDAEAPGAAIDTVRDGAAALDEDDRPPLLEFAAALADAAGLVTDARALRRVIVDEHPRSGQAPGALLELARSLRSEEGGSNEARELLERLIIEYPRSALVPQARRELQQLGRAITANDSSGAR